LSYIVNTSSIATIIFGLITGKISNKIGHGGTMILGTILAVIGMIGIALGSLLVLIFIFNFLIGASYVLLTSSSYTYASVLIPEKHRGKLFAVYNATFFLSWGFAGTVISGPIIDLLGDEIVFSYQIGIIIGAIVALIGLIILVFLLFFTKKRNNSVEIS
jgi:SP family galactose:H+ symporter-like MFS transporter